MTNRSRIASTLYLTDAATRGHAPTYSETAQSLVGRPRVAWELAHGASAVPGETPSIPLNPQGQYGVDMSGPPFGPCLLMHVASVTFQTFSESIAPANPWNAINSGTESTFSAFPFRFFNRFHATREDGLAPLQRLTVRVRVSTSGGSGNSDFVLRARQLTTGDERSVTTTLGLVADGLLNTMVLPCAPGINDVQFFLRRTSGTRVLRVRGLMLHVAAKRRHGLTFPG
jgi:hypothetical protein